MEEIMAKIAHHINGAHAPSNSDRAQPVYNPATGSAENSIALASTEEVDAVVMVAKAAWPEWSKTSPLQRARILDRFKTILWDRMY